MIVTWLTAEPSGQLVRPVHEVVETARAPWSAPNIGDNNCSRQRDHRDATEQQRKDGVTMREPASGEGSDTDHCHDRVPLAAAGKLIVGALRSGGDQRRTRRSNVAEHAPSVAPQR